MKIGLSFGRCIRDIVNEKVNIDDVMLIISRTDMSERKHITNVIDSYLKRQDYLFGLNKEACLDVAIQLWESQKIHQPRSLGRRSYFTKVPENYIWFDVVPTMLSDFPVVEKAWKNYTMALKLVAESLPKDDFEG